jgi:hypothetical protein
MKAGSGYGYGITIRPKDNWSIQCAAAADMHDEIEPLLADLYTRGCFHKYDIVAVNGKEYMMSSVNREFTEYPLKRPGARRAGERKT